MSDIVQIHDIGDLLKIAGASAFTSVTAAGAGDNTAVVGSTIDRLDAATGSLARSAAFALAWTTTLAATKTLSFKTVKVEQSSDGTNWDATAYFTLTVDPGVVATGPGGGGTVAGTTQVNVDLNSAKRYVRFDWTPDLSNTATDTATIVAAGVLAGYDRIPA
jgi:hypothetical protein